MKQSTSSLTRGWVVSRALPVACAAALQVKVFDPWEDEAESDTFDEGEDYDGSKDACCVIS